MKAIRVHQHGDASALKLDEVAVPTPAAGEILVKLHAAGLNFIDIYQRSGVYKLSLPATLGMEGAGVVDALGEGVTTANIGDRVAWAMRLGSYADYAVLPAWLAAPVPQGASLDQAAAIMLQGMTAHYLAYSTFALRPGHTCVVHAAAGGVGLLLVQLAKKCGATVIGTVGSEEKAALSKQAGADHTIIYSKEDFEARVKDITNGKLCEVVYDSVGKDTFLKSLNCLKPRGYAVLYGGASGQVEPLDLQILNAKGSLFTTRPSLGAYIQNRDELLSRTNDLFGWIAKGELDVRIDKKFALADAGAAHTYMEGRGTKGKVLLMV
jgi:NADPH2:quinone reductase